MRRSYRYTVDLKGQLFLQGQARPYRDPAFLDFFFSRVERIDAQAPSSQGYAWQSRCGREMNFIAPADTPIVFKSLVDASASPMLLLFAGTLTEPFDPAHLRVRSATGRLYYLAQTSKAASVGACLLSSTVALELSKHIAVNNDDGGRLVYDAMPIPELAP